MLAAILIMLGIIADRIHWSAWARS